MSLPPEDPDAWLDAFDPADLDDPQLDEIDASADRINRAVGRASVPAAPQAGASAPAAGLVGRASVPALLLALAAGALFGAWWVQAPTTPVPVAAPHPVPVPVPLPVPETAPAPTPEPAEVAATPDAGEARPIARPERATHPEPAPEPAVAEEPAEAVVAAPEKVRKQPGLIAHTDAKVVIQGDAAVISAGLLTFVRDETHQPGVERVVWRDLPLIARPVGTEFTVGSGPSLASIAVADGRVVLEHTDGSVLASLGPGDELSVTADDRSPLGLRLLHTDDVPLDELEALKCRCRPEDLVALVASLRFAMLRPEAPLGLTPDLPEAP
jgi:hypothetical protein